MSTASGCVAYNTDENSESLYEDPPRYKPSMLEDNTDENSESLYEDPPRYKPSMLEDKPDANSESLYEDPPRYKPSMLDEDDIYEEIPVSKGDIYLGNAAERNEDDGCAKFNP